MNGRTADPSVTKMRMLRRTRMMRIGASHHILVSFRNSQSSFRSAVTA